MNMLANAFSGRKVLVTGHTGFKGTWLSLWLSQLGAEVCGASIDIPTNPSMFKTLGMADRLDHRIEDVRDIKAMTALIEEIRPDFIFHLAAQPIVSLSYTDPLETITTNAIGTSTMLEACRQVPGRRVMLAITSDKCYENVEWEWGYRENDRLGGKDIYSASKAAAEILFSAYARSFFDDQSCEVCLASVRAGNVIGGGDWAQDRIVVDCVQSWHEGRPVQIRSPEATRPWQHVLEPLSGYLALAAALVDRPELSGQSFNFGPRSEQNHTVVQLLSDLMDHWDVSSLDTPYEIVDNVPFNEAGLLKLNCDRALMLLKWQPTLHYAECIEMVGRWYSEYYKGGTDMYAVSMEQLMLYQERARTIGLPWAMF